MNVLGLVSQQTGRDYKCGLLREGCMNDGEVSGDVDRAGEHNWPHIFGQMRNGGSEKENETTTMFAEQMQLFPM
ncbi:hypothetical protein OUZ56_031125 [Daphnia magna]|uniref:Uncharacterized protein n=1 Tax=Daphnia magna TaxID=35525 RepID=A0ABQ9ZTC1_9CRUS|nr:hypothetical protein OUZ56_031125 [Daphnia magna]